MLIPIKYHNKNYPDHIKPQITEIAGHFDISSIPKVTSFSLHTEYSYGKRKFSSMHINNYNELRVSEKNGISQLWFSDKWSSEFANFIKDLCADEIPHIIEIHPPFNDYTDSMKIFLERYKIFEEMIMACYSNSIIMIENRMGSMYKNGNFIFSNAEDLYELCDLISSKNLRLKIALDIPQFFTTYGGPDNLSVDEITNLLEKLFEFQKNIRGIHLWGKKKGKNGRPIAHCGDLKTYFNDELKLENFLRWFKKFLLNDKRFFVPEVNSTSEDLHSIINDIESVNITFTNLIDKQDTN